MTKLDSGGRNAKDQHWNVLAVALLEIGVRVHVPRNDLNIVSRGDRRQCGVHVVAKMAISARQERQRCACRGARVTDYCSPLLILRVAKN